MKKYLFMTLSLVFGTPAWAQNLHSKEVPSIVRNTFFQKFPRALDVEWEKKRALYKVEFEVNHVDHEALISPQGKVVRHEFDVREADLPKAVRALLRKDYGSYRVDDTEQVEQNGRVYFKIELKRKGDKRDIFLDPNGKIVTPE